MSREKANDRIDRQISPSVGKRSGSTKVLVIIFGIIIVVLAGVVVWLLSGKESKVYNTVVTPDNIEEIVAQLGEDDFTPMGSYEVIMNTDWTFEDGYSPSFDAYVKNAETNQSTVYFTIALANDPDTDIYESPLIPVGSYMEDISLEGAIKDAGVYNAILTYHLVDEDNEEISTVSVNITITIKN